MSWGGGWLKAIIKYVWYSVLECVIYINPDTNLFSEKKKNWVNYLTKFKERISGNDKKAVKIIFDVLKLLQGRAVINYQFLQSSI